MSDADRELEDLLGPLRDGPVAMNDVFSAGSQRRRLLPGVRAQIEGIPARRRRARVLRRASIVGGALVAIGALALSVVAVQRAGQPVALQAERLHIEPGSAAMSFIDPSGVRREIRGALTLQAPGELVGARDAWSHVSTARGVQLELAPRARLRVVATSADPAASSGLRLLQGEVHCRVPKLGKTRQFSIMTPDAQVVVHGTVFSVAVSDADRPTTCVRVDEGLVEVRSAGNKAFVAAGMQWGCDRGTAARAQSDHDVGVAQKPSARATTTPASVSAAAPAPAPRRAHALTPARRVSRARVQPPELEGTLDQENRLLASALAAERDGDLPFARKLFAQLLARHPNSPLIPEARLGLARAR